jgi:hypothetical protein
MADPLTIDQMYDYCQHKEAGQKQGNKFPFSVALEYCKSQFGVSPSRSMLSRVWIGRDQWKGGPRPQARRPKRLEEEEGDALPPILLDDAREAAAKIARFVTENCYDFGADVKFKFDKKIAAVLNMMMIERFRSKAQSTLDAFLV